MPPLKKNDPPLIIRNDFKHPIESVWKALTVHSEMLKWYFVQIPAFEPEIGFQTSFFVDVHGRPFTHEWEITKIIPPSLIRYDWTFAEYPGRSYSLFELSESEGITELQVTVGIIEDFPDGIPEFTWESCEGGWKYFINGELGKYLDKKY